MYFNEDSRKKALEAFEEKQHAEEKLESAFNSLLDSIERFDLNDKKLWKVISILVKKFHWGKEVNRAVHNMFCDLNEEVTYYDVLRMINTQSHIKNILYNPMDDFVTDSRGDDSYSDLLDSMFLAGPKIIAKCLSKEYSTMKEFVEDLKNEVGENITDIIINGENYFRMTLVEKARTRVNYLPELSIEKEETETTGNREKKFWYELEENF